MKPIRRLAFYGVSNNEQWIEKCIEGVGEREVILGDLIGGMLSILIGTALLKSPVIK